MNRYLPIIVLFFLSCTKGEREQEINSIQKPVLNGMKYRLELTPDIEKGEISLKIIKGEKTEQKIDYMYIETWKDNIEIMPDGSIRGVLPVIEAKDARKEGDLFKNTFNLFYANPGIGYFSIAEGAIERYHFTEYSDKKNIIVLYKIMNNEKYDLVFYNENGLVVKKFQVLFSFTPDEIEIKNIKKDSMDIEIFDMLNIWTYVINTVNWKMEKKSESISTGDVHL